MKTIRNWIKDLPDGYRERAIVYEGKFNNNAWGWDKKADSLASAIAEAFPWGDTSEGSDFWQAVYNHYESRNLPPLL